MFIDDLSIPILINTRASVSTIRQDICQNYKRYISPFMEVCYGVQELNLPVWCSHDCNQHSRGFALREICCFSGLHSSCHFWMELWNFLSSTSATIDLSQEEAFLSQSSLDDSFSKEDNGMMVETGYIRYMRHPSKLYTWYPTRLAIFFFLLCTDFFIAGSQFRTPWFVLTKGPLYLLRRTLTTRLYLFPGKQH